MPSLLDAQSDVISDSCEQERVKEVEVGAGISSSRAPHSLMLNEMTVGG